MSLPRDPALLEMFRAEVDTHMAALNDGLLSLERDPKQLPVYESMMRAAHSIKGAAKIMERSMAVQVAHEVENCFVAAREGRLTIDSTLVDLLFEGVDVLGMVAQASDDADEELLVRAERAVHQIARASQGLAVVPSRGERASLPHRLADEAGSSLADVRPQGALDAPWVDRYRPSIMHRSREAAGPVRLDLSDVTRIDAVGLAFLAAATHSMADSASTPGCIRLVGVPQPLALLLRAVGIHDAGPLTASEG